MAIKFNVVVSGEATRSQNGVEKTIQYNFEITNEEYQEMFATMCAGCDTGKPDMKLMDGILHKFNFEEVLSL